MSQPSSKDGEDCYSPLKSEQSSRPSSPLQSEPSQCVYVTFIALSVLQLILACSTALLWVWLLIWYNVGGVVDEDGDSMWMTLTLASTSLFILSFICFALASGMGVFIGHTWHKARGNPEAQAMQMRWIGRVMVFIALHDLVSGMFLLSMWGFRWFWPLGILALELLLRYTVSIPIIKHTRKVSQDHFLVPQDLEYTVLSSILLVVSTEQVISMLPLFMNVVAQYFVSIFTSWTNYPDFLAGLCYSIGLIAALPAALIGIVVSAMHLLSNKDEVGGKDLRSLLGPRATTRSCILTACRINAVNLTLGSLLTLVAGGLDDVISILVYLGTACAVLARMYWLCPESAEASAQEAVVAHSSESDSEGVKLIEDEDSGSALLEVERSGQ